MTQVFSKDASAARKAHLPFVALTPTTECVDDAGSASYNLLVDPKDPTRAMLYEVYLDDKAFEAHQQTAHFKKYLAEAVPLLASRERHVWKREAPR